MGEGRVGRGRRASSRLRNAARKMVVACGSFSRRHQAIVDPVGVDTSNATTTIVVLGYQLSQPPRPQKLLKQFVIDKEDGVSSLPFNSQSDTSVP